MTRVKICGITNLDDAMYAVECGADALGFIAVAESPRYVGRFEGWEAIPFRVPPPITCVCVCRRVEEALPGFDTLQTYSLPPASRGPNRRLVLAVRIADAHSLDELQQTLQTEGRQQPAALLLDAYSPTAFGGTGERFDWSIAQEAIHRFTLPIILAGGLTPENVGEAILAVRPWMVDVASGVEAGPGRKDHAKVRAFCSAVAEANRILAEGTRQ